MSAVTSPLPADPEERRALVKAIRGLARALDIQSRRIDREAGLTLPQYIVLAAIRDLGTATSRDIARDAELSPATVVGILDKLETKGLVSRVRPAEDRRTVLSRVTPEGHAILARLPSPLGPGFEAAVAALPDEARARLVGALRDLAALARVDTEAPEGS